jgi:hypothetical protein
MRIHYRYLSRSGKPFACVASEVVDGSVRFGLSVCNPKDSFKKEMGRKIALGRMQTVPRVTPVSDKTAHGITKAIMQALVDDHERFRFEPDAFSEDVNRSVISVARELLAK